MGNELIKQLRDAQKEYFNRLEATACEECTSLFGPIVKKITKKYCADCYLEINL